MGEGLGTLNYNNAFLVMPWTSISSICGQLLGQQSPSIHQCAIENEWLCKGFDSLKLSQVR